MAENSAQNITLIVSNDGAQSDFIHEHRTDLNNLLEQLTGQPGTLTHNKLNWVLGQLSFFILLLVDNRRAGAPVIGMATIDFTETVTKLRAVVEDVIVDDRYRGQGLGGRLLDAMIEIARTRQATSIILTSNSVRVAAHKLYESRGFVRRDTNVFILKLT